MESLDLVRQNKLVATGLAVGLTALPALAYAYSSYRTYVSFGPHGLPDNLRGWLKQASWHSVARSDTRSPAPYAESDLGPIYGPEARRSYLAGGDGAGAGALAKAGALAPRVGPRPAVPSYCAPQRQTTQAPSPDMVARQNDFFGAVGRSNASLFDLRTSQLEKVGRALFIAGGREVPAHLARTGAELVHIHPEGSTHVFLSLPDAEAVIAAGWGERHKLCGPIIPWGYTLVYGPRDEQEFRVWKDILKASVTYFAAGEPLSYPE